MTMNVKCSYSYYIGIGSTTLRQEALDNLLLLLRESIFPRMIASPAYSTEGVGSGTGKQYVNSVALLYCELKEAELNTLLKAIEKSYGRKEDSGEVALDLDIVISDGEIVRPKEFRQTYFQQGFKQIKELHQ